MPKQLYNLRADMKEKPDPLIHPGTRQPLAEQDLYPIFCEKLAHQELDNDTRYIDIPEPVLDMYKLYRPSPLCRAYNLEKALDTPAKIYYKFEGNNTSGSHKLNSAIAQAYYAKEQGLKGLTTETGAGQWGTALSEACAYFGLDLKVFMVKVCLLYTSRSFSDCLYCDARLDTYRTIRACESFFLASDGSYTGAVEQIAEEQAAKSERSRVRSALQLDVLQRSLHSAEDTL